MEFTGWLCFGGLFFVPAFCFALGFWLGRNGLPYRIVKIDDDDKTYTVEV